MAGHSLHIAVSTVDVAQYGDATFPTLLAPRNDARAYEELAGRSGYARRLHLYDEQATAGAVLGVLATLARELVVGDLLLLTYSGHGSQGSDGEGDEDDDDEESQDETWALHDRQLFDDELWTAWSLFRAGVRIVVVSDSCHSGTILRLSPRPERPAALPAVRATAGRSRRLPPAIRKGDLARRADLYRGVKAAVRPPEEVVVEATVLLLAACQDHQEAAEERGGEHGFFTRAFLETWSPSFGGGYLDFFERVRDALHREIPWQTANYLPLGREDLAFERRRPLDPS